MDQNEMVEAKLEDMDDNMLLKIFATFSLMDLVLNISSVCKSWRLLCSDKSLWKTLDLTQLNNFIDIPFTRLAWSDDQSSERFWHVLKHFLNLSDGNFSTVVFHLYITITDKHLVYTAKRCPNMRKLVLPGWNLLTAKGFRRVFKCLKNLESLVIPSHNTAPYKVLELIGENLKNLSNLKFRCLHFDIQCATSLLKYLPKLKALSLKCSLIKGDAIEFIIDNFECLEELNLSHCRMHGVDHPQFLQIAQPIYERIIQKASRLEKFYVCRTNDCVGCNDEFFPHPSNIVRWQELWRTDEIKSLAY